MILLFLGLMGNDEAWLKQRLQYFSDYTVNQYRDWDILKYWFRGMKQVCPLGK